MNMLGKPYIEGNNIVSDATIVSKIKIRAGQPYNENVINTDVKNLYASGFFETVEAKRQDEFEGLVVVFVVRVAYRKEVY